MYAIGEIFLVIVGILLALQINQYSLKKTNQKRFHYLLESMQKELLEDIESRQFLIESFSFIDSVIYVNLKNITKMDSIIKNNPQHIFFPHFDVRLTKSNQASFNGLWLNQDIIPVEHVKLFHNLYEQYKTIYEYELNLQEFNTLQASEADQLFKKETQMSNEPRVIEQYFKSNFSYKLGLSNSQNLNISRSEMAKVYNEYAMNNYVEIAKILKQDTLKLEFLPNKEKLKPFLGNYRFATDTTKVSLKLEKNKLFLTISDLSFYYLGKDSIELKKINDSTYYFVDKIPRLVRLKTGKEKYKLILPHQYKSYTLEKINKIN